MKVRRLTRFQTLCSGAACALLLTCVQAAAKQADAQKSSAPSKTTATTKHHTTHAATSSAAKKSSSHTTSTKGKPSSSRRKKRTARGQQKIDSERAQSIQEALIREHYLTGEATGKWNQASEDAMRRYQGDHGWQTKTVPDSRALIKLGLGPSKDHLLNPESAMTTGPDAPRAASLTPTSHSPGPATPVSKTPTAEPLPASTSPQDSSRPQ
jgi:putative peptidoglycan binding protein